MEGGGEGQEAVILRRGLLGDCQFPGREDPWVVRGPRVRSWDSVQGSLGFSICPIMWGRSALCGQEGQAPGRAPPLCSL